MLKFVRTFRRPSCCELLYLRASACCCRSLAEFVIYLWT